LFRTSCALLGVALLLSACGDSSHGQTSPPPPPAAPRTDIAGIGIAVYAPPEAYKGTLSSHVLPGDARNSVAVFGDSLTVQSWDYVNGLALYGGLHLIGDRFSGTALCDWRDGITQALTTRPSFLVFGFAGNNVTECTGHRVGAALGKVYERDARAVVKQAKQVGTHVIIVGPPDMGLAYINRNAKAVRAAFKRVADDEGADAVTFVDSRDNISPDGYTSDANCKSWETVALGCRAGKIGIRYADKVHWSRPNIYGYSGGAWRWATTLFENVKPAPDSPAMRD
jgi:hypothetical protein